MKKLIITGNVGRDAENRATPQGDSFVTFSVGVSVGTKQKPKTDWVEVSCNGKLADIAILYVKKGGKVLVEGFPSSGAYIDRENKPVAQLRLYANTLELLSGKEDKEAMDFSGTTPLHHTVGALNSDDVPF